MESSSFISSTWHNVKVFPVTKTFSKAVYVVTEALQARIIERAELAGHLPVKGDNGEVTVYFN